jgi:hypothetical protein
MTSGRARWILPSRRLITSLLSRIGGTNDNKEKNKPKI